MEKRAARLLVVAVCLLEYLYYYMYLSKSTTLDMNHETT